MTPRVQMIGAIIGVGATLFVAGCGSTPEPAESASPAQMSTPLPEGVPPGSTLKSSTTTVENGQAVNRQVFRAPHQVVFNRPICSKGDPQYPACLNASASQ